MYKLIGLTGLLSLGMLGCDGGSGTGNGEPDGPGTTDGNPDDLPELFADVAYESRCDGIEDSDGNFQDVAGALRVWGGSFEFVGEPDEDGAQDVRGSERLKVFGNSAWLDADPDNARAECEAVWSISGTVTEDGSGDFQIAFSANYSDDDSTCAPGWGALAYDPSWEDSYDVTLTCPDGEICDAVFNWTDTGNKLADGHAAGNFAQYQAEAGCQFY